MAGLYEDLLEDLEEIIAMENGTIDFEEIPDMPVRTFVPKFGSEDILNA